ncbi:MAG: class 3 adenylate cyclase, partial [Candidatus Azotimanducaceae bacterium]
MKDCVKCNQPSDEEMNFCGRCGQTFALLKSGDRERRQVTVLFSDIVNFTRYTASINDDDVPEVLEIYQSIVKNAVFKQNGFIAQILGDGVMAYFGYPSALENATEHAIRAGLDIINDIKSMAGDKYDLKVRVGIHHGSGVITNVGGEGRLLVGNTPNVAARMQAIAESNTLVISEPTYQATRGLFEVVPLGHRDVKGLSEPLEVFNVLNHKEVRRFDIDRQHDMGTLTGRQFELARLEEQFAIAQKSNSFVLVSGQAGIGKSRLLHEFEHQIAGDSVWVTHRCSAYRSDSAFQPLRRFLNQTIGLSERRPDEPRIEKIHHFLDSLSITDTDSKNILVEFLSPENSISQKDYGQIETLLINITRLVAQDQRVIISLEDAHWVNQSTIDFLKRLFESQTDGGLMIIVTARPEFSVERLGKVPLDQITLGQLGEEELTRLIREHLGNKVINAEVPEFIISKADGNPLFVKELTHALVETGVITEINGQVQLDLARSFQVPETLNDTLSRRVDQLGAARYVAQVAAVIGREFDHELLTSV